MSTNLLDENDTNDETSSIRFVTSVNSLLYKQVGFDITYERDGKTYKATSASNKVYSSLYECGSDKVWSKKPADVFCNLSQYFKICTLKNFTMETYCETEFTVTPYWITADGAKVYGVSATKSIAGALSKITVESSAFGTIDVDVTRCMIGDTVTIKNATALSSAYYFAGVQVDGEVIETDSEGNYSFATSKNSHVVKGVFRKKIFKDNAYWNLTEQNQGTKDGVTTGTVAFTDSNDSGTVENQWLYLYESEAGAAEYGDIDLTLNIKDYDKDNFNVNTQIKFEINGTTVFRICIDELNADKTTNTLRIWKVYGGDYGKELYVFSDEEVEAYQGEGLDVGVRREGTTVSIYVAGVKQASLSLLSGYDADAKMRVSITHDNDIGKVADISYKLAFPSTISLNNTGNGTLSIDAQKDVYYIGETIKIKTTPNEGNYLSELQVDGKTVEVASDGTYSFLVDKVAYELTGFFREKIFNDHAYWDLTEQNQGTVDGVTTGVVTFTDSKSYATGDQWLYMYESETGVAEYGDVNLTLNLRDYDLDNYDVNTQIKFEFDSKTAFRICIDESSAATNDVKTAKFRIWNVYGAELYVFSEAELAAYESEGLEVGIRREGAIVSIYVGGEKKASLELRDGATADTKVRVAIMHDNDIGIPADITYKLELPSEITLNSTGNGTLSIEPQQDVYHIDDTVTIIATPDEGNYLSELQVDGQTVKVGSNGKYSFTVSESTHEVEGIFKRKIFNDNAYWDLTKQNQGTEDGVTTGLVAFTDNRSYATNNQWLYLYESETGVGQYSDVDLTLNIKDYDTSNYDVNTQIKLEVDATAVFRICIDESSVAVNGVKKEQLRIWNVLNGKELYVFSTQETTAYKNGGLEVGIRRDGAIVSIYMNGNKQASIATDMDATAQARVAIMHDNDIGIKADISYELSFPTFYINDLKTTLSDPFVLDNTEVDNYYYLYGTGRTGDERFYAYRSKDLMNWETVGIVFDTTNLYDNEVSKELYNEVWAPEVVRDGDTYYMFFSATPVEDSTVSTGNGQRLLMVASSQYPDKGFKLVNFKDSSSCEGYVHSSYSTTTYPHYYAKYLMFEPNYYNNFLASNGGASVNTGGYTGAIDPHPFVDDNGEKYLFWKVEGAAPTRICVMKMINWLQPDWSNVKVVLVSNYYTVSDWSSGSSTKVSYEDDEISSNEAPQVIKHNGKYYLTYSMNDYETSAYQVGVAVADSIMGTYRKLTEAEGSLLLASANLGNNEISGTGHHSFVTVEGQLYIVYHRHDDAVNGGANRNHAIDEVKWITIEDKNGNDLDVMYVNGPTTTVQPKIEAYSRYKNIADEATVSGSTNASYLTDGLLSVQKNGNSTFMQYVKETSISGTTTFTFDFSTARKVGAIMVYNSKTKSTIFKNISQIELICEEDGEYVSHYINNVAFSSDYYTKNSSGTTTYVVPGSAAYAMFEELNVKTVKITVEVPSGQSAVGISEIKILGK